MTTLLRWKVRLLVPSLLESRAGLAEAALGHLSWEVAERGVPVWVEVVVGRTRPSQGRSIPQSGTQAQCCNRSWEERRMSL